jgi:hypothetical protein
VSGWNIRVRIPAEEAWGDLEGDAMAGAIAVVERAADMAVARARQILQSAGAGAGAAAPGAPPRERTGDLGKSIMREPATAIASRKGARGVTTRVLVTDPGGARQEFGDIDVRGIRTFPHPFLRPAFEDIGADVDGLFHAWARGT